MAESHPPFFLFCGRQYTPTVVIAFAIPRSIIAPTARPPHVAPEIIMSHHTYSYLERRYSRKTRLQVFLLLTGLSVALVGGLAALEMSETDAERNARGERLYSPEQSVDRESVTKRQSYTLHLACEQGPDACAEAQEEIRKQNCQLYRVGCKSLRPKWQPDPLFGDVDKQLQERLKNMQ